MYRIDNILEVSRIQREGFNNFSQVKLNSLFKDDPNKLKEYEVLTKIPGSFAEAAKLPFTARLQAKKDDPNASDMTATLMTPPDETYTDILPEEGYEFAAQVDSMVTKQFIQRFYETYMVPIAGKDVFNRLGQVSGNINDVHMLFPSGLPGLIGKDIRGSWRTNINYSFEVNEEVKDSKGKDIKYTFTSLAFPPYISHEVLDETESSTKDEEEIKQIKDRSFDMKNILYKRNVGTFRFPAFKQVNDNIKTLQMFLNRCFGIESTYMNEWDFSLYMQEGLVSYTEIPGDEGTLKLPQFVTTLTYGLLDDAPVKELKDLSESKGSYVSNVDLGLVETFASLNMAVSTRYGVDTEALGTPANEQIYEINKFPLSTYWYPFDNGNLQEDMNVSIFYDEMFSYRENGLAYNTDNPNGRPYTNKLFHGGDLSKSSKRFLQVLNYYDNRRAVMANWNSTDENGEVYFRNSDFTNKSLKSNAFSHIPFWKQLYSSEGDGLGDIDLYMQEIAASNGQDVSIINSGYQIIAKQSNDTFQDFCEERAKEDAERKMGRKFGEDEPFTMTIPKEFGDDNYQDMKFSLFKCKLKIPGSKLLNMFLNRKSKTSAAMNKANQAEQGMSLSTPNTDKNSGGSGSKKPGGVLANATPTVKSDETKTVYVDGVPQEVEEYYPEADDTFASKKSVGDGIVEHSPFLYGGPHGKFYSPLTVEGYCQVNNENLATVPTMDSYSTYYGSVYNGQRGFEHTKNFKNSGTYVDKITAITPNERTAVVNNDAAFGLKIEANTERYVTYRSSTVRPQYVYSVKKYNSYNYYGGSYYNNGYYSYNYGYYYDYAYYKNWKYSSGRMSRWIFDSEEFLESRYNSTCMQVRKEDDVPFQPDYTTTDFKLIPVTRGFNQSFAESPSNIDGHISHDDSKYAVQDHSTNAWKNGCVKYMVVPSNIGANLTCGSAWLGGYNYDAYKHYVSYYEEGKGWSQQLKTLYDNGVRNIWCSLPISNGNSSEILTMVCGIARIEKSKALGWGWCYKPHEAWGWRSRRHWCHSHCYYYRYTYYTWEWALKYVDTYNLYFYPGMIKYNFPTENLIRKEYKPNTGARNKDSSNIIERYTVNDANRFDHINHPNEANAPLLFPFTKKFMNKYGTKESICCPGWTYSGHYKFNNYPILHSRGLLWGNIAEDYATEGIVKKTTAVSPVTKTYPGTASYMSEELTTPPPVNWDNWWRYSYMYVGQNVFTDVKTETEAVTYYSVVPFWKRTGWVEATELTNYFKNCQKWPAIQRYQDNYGAHSVWYDPLDQYDVFIDTITQQIAWMKQLKTYVSVNLTDSIIFDVYRKAVDQHIQDVIEKEYSGQQYSSGWTTSYTEDIAYDDALAIVRRVFKTEDPDKNTLEELLTQRISYLNSIKTAACTLRSRFQNGNSTDASLKFMRLVTNINAYLQGATTNGISAESALFDANGNYNLDYPTEFPINTSSTFNLLRDPAAILWAYINILYHVRKYWINMRFNKRAGSYWNLRGLERVLIFLKSDQAASDDNQTPVKSIPTGQTISLKKKKIQFVQARDSFTDRVNSSNDGLKKQQMTKAVYIKVDYLSNPSPKTSSKWNEKDGTYDGLEIRYVKESYKWAYKPMDGLYYVMSKSIMSRISNYISSLRDVITSIGAKDYIPMATDVAILKNISGKDYTSLGIDGEKTLNELLSDAQVADLDKKSKQVELFTEFQNNLAKQKRDYYDGRVKELLFPVYIRWEPEHVWTGVESNDTKGNWWIDENQKEATTGVKRKVKDLYGFEHTDNEAISAGITFDVAATIDPETLLSDPDALKRSSLLEILCSTVNNMDLWRIQIPAEVDIPTSLLKDEPVLVPAYQIDMSVQPFANGKMRPTVRSVLAGIDSGLSPVQEAGKDMLTVNSMAALGLLNDISDAGLNIPGASSENISGAQGEQTI